MSDERLALGSLNLMLLTLLASAFQLSLCDHLEAAHNLSLVEHQIHNCTYFCSPPLLKSTCLRLLGLPLTSWPNAEKKLQPPGVLPSQQALLPEVHKASVLCAEGEAAMALLQSNQRPEYHLGNICLWHSTRRALMLCQTKDLLWDPSI